MRAASLLILGAGVATLYGFVPTGVVSLAYALRAASLAAQGRSPDEPRAAAATWLLATLLIGAAVEAPVLAATLH